MSEGARMDRRQFLKVSMAVAGSAALPLAAVAAPLGVVPGPAPLPALSMEHTMFHAGRLELVMLDAPSIVFEVPGGPQYWEVTGNRARYRPAFIVDATEECAVSGYRFRIAEGRLGFPGPEVSRQFAPPRHLLPGDQYEFRLGLVLE